MLIKFFQKFNLKSKCKEKFYSFYNSETLILILNNIFLKIISIINIIKAYINKSSKVFGIGLPKTGTTSLAASLKELGYKTIDYPHLPSLYKEINNHDAITDISLMINIEKLDRIYPNSKFILTIREIDSWLKSIKNHLKKLFSSRDLKNWEKKIMKNSYGVSYFDRDKFIRFFNKYNLNVKTYFRNRPNNLLVLDIIRGEGYDKLCTFLNKEILKKDFPHKNIGKY